MKRLSYLLFVCVLFRMSVISCVYGEDLQTTNNESRIINTANGTEEDQKEIRIKKDEFDEIVGQLQGMKTIIENMKMDYDARLTEMQEKIATLEKEKAELEKAQLESVEAIHELPLPRIENKLTVAEVETETSKVPVSNEKQKPLPSQADTSTSSPHHPKPYPFLQEVKRQSLCCHHQEIQPQQGQPASSGQWSPAQPITLLSTGKGYMNISFDGLFAAGVLPLKIWKILKRVDTTQISAGSLCKIWKQCSRGQLTLILKGRRTSSFRLIKTENRFLKWRKPI